VFRLLGQIVPCEPAASVTGSQPSVSSKPRPSRTDGEGPVVVVNDRRDVPGPERFA
jgi:hypothetical protein